MKFEQVDVTGCRLIGAINKELGHAGPKHHGVIIGKNLDDENIYVAESMHTGYQLATYDDFYERYSQNGSIKIKNNDGHFDNLTVAQRALEEIKIGGKGVYNLVANNCECFANRAMHDKSKSQQIINTTIGVAAIAGAFYLFKKMR